MATVQTALITRALRLVGRLGSGRSPTANETADVLLALNALLESWRLERLLVYALTEASLTLVVGDSSYTVGPSGDVNTTRPVKVVDAYMRENGIDYPVTPVIDVHQWNSIAVKTVSSNIIEYLYYNPANTQGVLQVYPVPSLANTLYLTLWTPLDAFAAATETLALPPGYERALAYNLAVEINPEFGSGLSNDAKQIAIDAKAAIKRVNLPSMQVVSPLRDLFPRGRTNIESDGL